MGGGSTGISFLSLFFDEFLFDEFLCLIDDLTINQIHYMKIFTFLLLHPLPGIIINHHFLFILLSFSSIFSTYEAQTPSH